MTKKLLALSCALILLAAVAVVIDWQPIRGGDITTHVYTGPTPRQESGQGIPGGRAVVWDNGMNYDALGASQYDSDIQLDPIEADDFMFSMDQPVNDVHWIGGYWNGPPDDGNFDWEIKFYNDDGSLTKPGAEIATYYYANANVNETWIDGVPGDVNFYSYSVTLPSTMTFGAGVKYWISIQGIGIYPPQSGWGYHESPILLHQAVFKSVYFGYPDWVNTEVVFGGPVDMCFQLTYEEECIWNPGDPHKMHWPQLPDEDGWDVNASYPIVLADDFLCTQTGYIKDVHFWGSWKHDIIGEIYYFILSFHSNIPEELNPEGFSKPGDLLWATEVSMEFVNVVPIDPPTAEGWYDPWTGEVFFDDHWSYFQYNICFDDFLDEEYQFWQDQDSVYWLNISAVLFDPAETQWGWKSTEDHWMDDAVWSEWGMEDWQEIYEPQAGSEPITNMFWVEFGPDGLPINAGGTDYYDDGTSFNGWYFYQNTGWWNIWFYDHPFDPTRYKEIYVFFDWMPTNAEYWIEAAVNWATPYFPPGGPPPIPPLDPAEEEMFIYREWIPITGPGPVEFFVTVPDYNPEWVSIDIMGMNIAIYEGMIEHQCLPADQDSVSLDLAFVITGGAECTPSVDVEKRVWDYENSDWVELVDIEVNQGAEFEIAIHNDGTCCDLTDITVTDTLDDSFEFIGATPYPEIINEIPGGTELIWYFSGPLEVCNWIYINLYAQVLGPVCHVDTNRVFVEAMAPACDEIVTDADDAAVHAVAPPLDFGDVPDAPYPTLLASDGARHPIVPEVYLGQLIDAEADGQPSADALGDDNSPAALGDDEDGVVFTAPIFQGQAATMKVTASVPGFLNAWADWNNDGDWDDYVEQIFTDQPLNAGVNVLTVVVPSNAYVGTIYSRFRFNTTGDLSYTGLADDGEVEDYRLFIVDPIEDVKMHWPQWPDLESTGMDVDMFYVDLADDFLCTETGPILDIHFWGSFADDIIPPAGGPGSLVFQVRVYSNIPADQNPDGYWSKPGELLWERFFYPGDYICSQVCDNNPEDWYDPVTEYWINDNHLNAYQYDFYIPEDSAFIQDEGAIYWLGIKELWDVPPEYRFGWKTSRFDLRWMDDAAFLLDPPFYWLPLWYPPMHEYVEASLDLAFVITGGAAWVPGDADGSGGVDIDDVVYLIAYIFSSGPPPNPYAAGDVDCSGFVDIDDVVYLIAYIFSSGPPPNDPNNDGIPDC